MQAAIVAVFCLQSSVSAQPITVRVATFNIEDVRGTDLVDDKQPRLKNLARVINTVKPNILLLNEIAYDMAGSPGFKEGDTPGQNAQRFVDLYVHPGAADGIRYKVYMPETNTGVSSGFDLDNDGNIVTTFPVPPGAKPDGSPGEQTAQGRAYGNDCWGFGTFPGQYGMALLVDERLTIDTENIRTFARLPWDYIQGAYLPTKVNTDGTPTSEGWYSEEELKYVRISSKTMAVVPVKLPSGAVVHIIASHPTPPAFDGPEQRNKKRNHDEIRLIGDFIDGMPYLVDDNEKEGGLGRFDSFIVMGDLNADPKKGSSFKDPMTRHLLTNRRVNGDFVPVSDVVITGLEPSDTARFKMRVDYVLPSVDIKVLRGAVYREAPTTLSTSADAGKSFPSDHFPVYLDVQVPAPPIKP